MAVTLEQLDDFHRFASEMLSNGGRELSWGDLILLWQDSLKQDQVNAGIRKGIEEMNAGLGRPLDEFMDEFRQKHNIPPDA